MLYSKVQEFYKNNISIQLLSAKPLPSDPHQLVFASSWGTNPACKFTRPMQSYGLHKIVYKAFGQEISEDKSKLIVVEGIKWTPSQPQDEESMVAQTSYTTKAGKHQRNAPQTSFRTWAARHGEWRCHHNAWWMAAIVGQKYKQMQTNVRQADDSGGSVLTTIHLQSKYDWSIRTRVRHGISELTWANFSQLLKRLSFRLLL